MHTEIEIPAQYTVEYVPLVREEVNLLELIYAALVRIERKLDEI